MYKKDIRGKNDDGTSFVHQTMLGEFREIVDGGEEGLCG